MNNLNQNLDSRNSGKTLWSSWILWTAILLIIGIAIGFFWLYQKSLSNNSPLVEAANPVVDQSCTYMGDETSYQTIRNNFNFGQTFVVGNIGQITAIKLRLGSFPGDFDGTATVSLTRLSDSHTFTGQTLSFASNIMKYPDEIWYTFNFATPVSVSAGERYRINVINSSADWYDVFWISNNLGNCYANGTITENGAENDFYDFMFQVIGYPTEAVTPSGTNGSTTPSSSNSTSSSSRSTTGSSTRTSNNQQQVAENSSAPSLDSSTASANIDQTNGNPSNDITLPCGFKISRLTYYYLLNLLAMLIVLLAILFLLISHRKRKRENQTQ